jgi:hypothetical protein
MAALSHYGREGRRYSFFLLSLVEKLHLQFYLHSKATPTMAPHAEATFIDTSGYTPSNDAIKELKALLELDHPILPSRVTKGAQRIDSHDRDEFPKDWILQLSLNHLQEIEDAIAVFESL